MIRMKKNRIRICGRNTTTDPTPAMIPCVRKSRKIDCGISLETNADRAVKPASIASANGVAQANTAWNITNRKAKRISGPIHGFSNSRSSPLATVCRALRERIAARAIVLAASRRSGSVRCQLGLGASSAWVSAAAIAAVSSSSPRRRTATVEITGTPSASSSAFASSVSPSRSARSIMLRATTVGRPSSSTSCANTRCCSRLAASSTRISTSGRTSPSSRPCTAFSVTTSSGLAASRE